jgi:hypothetical protein
MAPRTLAFCAFLLAAASARAATVSKNPCALDPKPTAAADILAAFAPNDPAWSNFLMDQRPQIIQQNGEWMEYKYGGYVTARSKSIEDAFVAFCDAKARAATATKKASMAPSVAPPAPAAPPHEAQVQATNAAAKDKTLLQKASLFFSSMIPEAPAEPTAAPVNCTALCANVKDCSDTGMSSGGSSLEFPCRKAAADARAAKCACGV